MTRFETAPTTHNVDRPRLGLARKLLQLGVLVSLLCTGSAHAGLFPTPPASLSDSLRQSDPTTGFVLNDDFTRLFFVKPGTAPVTAIGRVDKTYQGKVVQARAFMSATVLYQPALRAIDDAHFVGGDDPNPATYDLVAMRCRPTNSSQLEPALASWPVLFEAADIDLANLMGYTPSDCTPSPGPSAPVDLELYCMAHKFKDTPNQTIPIALQAAVNTGVAIFQLNGAPFLPTGSTTGANVLFDLYLVGSGFSGLGYAVKDSSNVALSAEHALAQSVVAEYLVKNVSLTEGSCRCVRVTPYPKRDQSFLDWNNVWLRGRLNRADGSCAQLPRLP